MKKKSVLFAMLVFVFGFMFLGDAGPITAQEKINDDVELEAYKNIDLELDDDIDLEVYEEYTYYSKEEGLYLFDTNAALKTETNKEKAILFGQIFNSLSREYKEDPKKAIDTVTTYSLNPTKYGNWCGKGQKGGTPIDDLDWACARHDVCYAQRGWGNSFCNSEFVKELRAIKNNSTKYNKLSWYGKTYLNAAILLFS